jgi:hypothetical protein
MGGGNIFDFFFGGGGPFGGMGGEEEDQIPKGDAVTVDLYVTLEDLYSGREIVTTRDKAIFVPAPGKRRCKCRQKLMTRQLGPGMIQQFTQQVGRLWLRGVWRHGTPGGWPSMRVLGEGWAGEAWGGEGQVRVREPLLNPCCCCSTRLEPIPICLYPSVPAAFCSPSSNPTAAPPLPPPAPAHPPGVRRVPQCEAGARARAADGAR